MTLKRNPRRKKSQDLPEQSVKHVLFRFGMSGCFKFTSVNEIPKHAHLRFFSKIENTPCWLTPWVSSSSLWLLTRWTPPSPHTALLGLRKSRRKCLASSRRSDITQLQFPSSPSPDGMETTCCRPVRTWTGTRAGLSSARKERPTAQPSLRLLTPSSHPRDLPTSPSGCHSRMFTKLEVLEQCQWAVSRLDSSSPAWSLLSPPTS